MTTVSRRKFILSSASIAAGSILLPRYVDAKNKMDIYKGGLVTGSPKVLPYKSIPGFLSEEQIAPHYTAHYGGALRGYIDADKKLQSSSAKGTLIDTSTYGAVQRTRTNKANSVLLHELYFDGMTANASQPSEEIIIAIEKRFGSIEKWINDFKASAKAASGWAILAYDTVNGKLYNIVSDEHATGVLWMAMPLIVIDVYEHAYYIDYKNKKTIYIEKFMAHINWEEVNIRFKMTG